jgi:hypothetical protein
MGKNIDGAAPENSNDDGIWGEDLDNVNENAEVENDEVDTPEQGEGADPDKSAKNKTARKDAKDNRGEVEEDESGDGELGEQDENAPEFWKNKFKELDEKFESFKKQLEEGAQKPEEKKPEAQALAMSDEQWAAWEEKNNVPRATAEFTTMVAARVVTLLRGEMYDQFAEIRKDDLIQSLTDDPSGKFKDAANFKGEIQDFLKSLPPLERAKPENLQRAYYYGKGRKSNESIKRASSSREIQKKVIGKVSGGPRPPERKQAKELTNAERAAARREGMTDAEYIKFRDNETSVFL